MFKAQKTIEIDRCKAKNAKSFHLQQEGAHPPPTLTPYCQPSWPCTALLRTTTTSFSNQAPPDENPGYATAALPPALKTHLSRSTTHECFRK